MFEADIATLKVYGRRRARKLRPLQKNLLKDLLPHLEVGDIEALKGGLGALFPSSCKEIWLEIGFGYGEHLIQQAIRHPQVGLIGAEFFLNGIAQLLKGIQQASKDQEINNIRIYREDARCLLPHLAEKSLERIFMLFPDPWPKLRHHKRRFLNKDTLDEYARLLKAGGRLRLASDDPLYVEHIEKIMLSHPSFKLVYKGSSLERPSLQEWPATRYERKAAEEGRKSSFFEFTTR